MQKLIKTTDLYFTGYVITQGVATRLSWCCIQ